jgi:hypothetical protein
LGDIKALMLGAAVHAGVHTIAVRLRTRPCHLHATAAALGACEMIVSKADPVISQVEI